MNFFEPERSPLSPPSAGCRGRSPHVARSASYNGSAEIHYLTTLFPQQKNVKIVPDPIF